MNVTEGLYFFSDDSINVGNEESGTSAFNKEYDKLQVKQDKAHTK